jgi:NitT/TauT family transport system substrate-binding protein
MAASGKRRLLFLAVGLVAFFCAGGPLAIAADKVIFGLDFAVAGRHAGYIVAREKGFYRDEGIDAEIQRGYGSTDAVTKVASGATTFSFGDVGSLVIARAQDVKVTCVAMVYGNAPYVLYMRKESKIVKPGDLEGKLIGSPVGAATRVLFPAFAKAANVDASKVKWLNLDIGARLPMLLARKIDATISFLPEWPTMATKAEQSGIELTRMVFSDYGMNIYSNGLLVRDDMLKANPDLVRRFVKATLKGLEFSFNNPAEAASILVSKYPELDVKTAAAEIAIVKDLAYTAEAKSGGLGYMDANKMRLTRDVVAEAFDIKKTVSYEALYSNAFLPAR